MPPVEHFTTIIVGAGLAGLTAAYELKDEGHPVLVLEDDLRLGGKVCTGEFQGLTYETGALFAFDPQWLPFPVAAGPLERAPHPIGLFHQGRLLTGDSVDDCLQGLHPGLRQLHCLQPFLASPTLRPELVGQDLALALRAFFRIIHPGDPERYVPPRRADSLLRHRSDRYQAGNAALVQALAERSGAEIRTGCQLTALHPGPVTPALTIHWRTKAGEACQAEAERVILAVPAPAALALCQGTSANVATAFLARVRYGAGIVVVLHCRPAELRPLSYVVSTQGQVNTFVFQRPAAAPDALWLTAYLVAEQAMACRELGDEALVGIVLDELNRLGLGTVSPKQVAFSQVRHWPAVGPIISGEAYHSFSNAHLRPLPGVVLAGDYTWWDRQQLPYGMWAAIASGRRAAQLCREPPLPPLSKDFAAAPLATTTISLATDDGPSFRERIADGTVAYYGLLLATQADPELEHYLLGEAVDGLWAYQQGYGVTALDSALVMEGLLSTGRHAEQLRRSACRLLATFYDEEAGAFWTMPVGSLGRAPYWQGADCLATACCGWLLERLDGGRYAEQIDRCRDYLLRQQRVSGGWPGKWFPSQTIPVWYALRFLTANPSPDPPDPAAPCRRAALWLASKQGADGAWAGSVIETAAALLALGLSDDYQPERARGQAWLLAARGEVGWPGEPILEYWFEEGGQRTLFHTWDRGGITSAWATLALASYHARGG